VRKFSFFVSLNISQVDTDSSAKVLSLATESDKFSLTTVSTTRSVQQHQLHGPHVRPTSMPYIFMCGILNVVQFGYCSLVSKGYCKNTHDTPVLTNVHKEDVNF